MKRFAGAICIACLSGCAQNVWVKPGASQSDFSSDRYTCIQEAQQRVGAAQVNAAGGAAVNTVVTNNQLFASCMNAHGWYLQRQPMGQQQPPYDPLRNASDTFTAQMKARCAEPELQPYFAKTTCNSLDIALEQLTDTSTITDVQKAALQRNQSEYIEQSRAFIRALRQFGGQKGNALASLRERLDGQGEANILQLYSGNITWGEYNRRRKEIGTEGRDKQNEIVNAK